MTRRRGTEEPQRDALVRLIVQLPADRKPAAGLGWRLGLLDGRADVYRELGRAGDDIRVGGLPELRAPSHLELQRRREIIDHQPCSRRCTNCSRCIHADAWRKRGSRPYAGAQREREIASTKS